MIDRDHETRLLIMLIYSCLKQRMNYANGLIEKDDAARDLLGLPKPTLMEFKDMTNLKTLTQKQNDFLCNKYKLVDKSNQDASGKKRASVERTFLLLFSHLFELD